MEEVTVVDCLPVPRESGVSPGLVGGGEGHGSSN